MQITNTIDCITMLNRKKLLVIGLVCLSVFFVVTIVPNLSSGPTRSPALPRTINIRTSRITPNKFVDPIWKKAFFNNKVTSSVRFLNTSPSNVPSPDTARTVAESVLTAQLINDPTLKAPYSNYLLTPIVTPYGKPVGLPYPTNNSCQAVDVEASHPTLLAENPPIAKVLLIWTGTCSDLVKKTTSKTMSGPEQPGLGDPNSFQASFVYLLYDVNTSSWLPIRVTQLPGSAAGVQDSGYHRIKPLVQSVKCFAGQPVRLQIEAAQALKSLCSEAEINGIYIKAIGGLRSFSVQSKYYQKVVENFGVLPSIIENPGDNNICTSRHCSGWAVDVTGPNVATWLSKIVGCQLSSGLIIKVMSDGSCPLDQLPVPNALQWGFSQPSSTIPTHLEYSLPPSNIRWVANCSPSPSSSVVEIVTATWRCVLGRAGLPAEEVQNIVAMAVATSRCLSGWNATAVVNPNNFSSASSAGVFLLNPEFVKKNSRGTVFSSSANSIAAAKLYLQERTTGLSGFSNWACAPSSAPQWAYRW